MSGYMADDEIMRALLDGEVLENGYGILLRLNPITRILESRAFPHDPDWTQRRSLFNGGDDRSDNKGRYYHVVTAVDMVEKATNIIEQLVKNKE